MLEECGTEMPLPIPDLNGISLHHWETRIFTILVGVMTVLCIILNAMGIYVFMRLPRTPSNLVYLHLCVTDLIVGVFVTPYSIIILSQELKSTNDVYCVLQGIMFEISYTTTLFILTYISLDRLLALYKPLKYKELMSPRAVFWINIGTWIVPVIRPIVRYIMRMVGVESPCQAYGYSNDDYFMVCYNTDYIAFVKDSGSKAYLPMLDQCIIVCACQLATLVSSILVVARLSHRLHIKRITKNALKDAHILRQSTLRKVQRESSEQSVATPSTFGTSVTTVGSPICVGGTHHFHPAPAGDDLSTVGEQSLREDEKTSKDLEDDSVEDTGVKKSRVRKKREAERHAIITMVTVIVFFMVTYTPSFICFIVPGIYGMAERKDQLWVFLLVDYCTFINSTFLPMVHFSRSSGFKRQLKTMRDILLSKLRIKGRRKTLSISERRGSFKTMGRSEGVANGDPLGQITAGGNLNHIHANRINSLTPGVGGPRGSISPGVGGPRGIISPGVGMGRMNSLTVAQPV